MGLSLSLPRQILLQFLKKDAVTRKLQAEKNSKMKKEAVWPVSNHHESSVKMHQLCLIS